MLGWERENGKYHPIQSGLVGGGEENGKRNTKCRSRERKREPEKHYAISVSGCKAYLRIEKWKHLAKEV